MATKSRPKISFIISAKKTITATIEDRTYIVPKSKIGYSQCLEALQKDDPVAFLAGVNQHIEVIQKISEASNQTLFIKGNQIIDSQTGKPVHKQLVATILKMRDEGQDYNPLFRFLERLSRNPSKNAADELYNFLSKGGLPICTDGCFLGYKRVTSDYMDVYSGKVKNKVGTVIQMKRNEVDDDNRYLCSTGFHVGHWAYVQSYGSSVDPIVVVKVDPADVVAVDGNGEKLRTCRYLVLSNYRNRAQMDLTIYTGDEKKPEEDRVKPQQATRESRIKQTMKKIRQKLKKK